MSSDKVDGHTSEPTRGESSPASTPAHVVVALYGLLFPLQPDDRTRAIDATMLLFGERRPSTAGVSAQSAATTNQEVARVSGEFEELNLGPKARKWIDRHKVQRSLLEEVFHFADGQVEITASLVPGASKRDKTTNAYLLEGIRNLLAHDVATFQDTDAIAVCKRLDAYDKNNHSVNRNSIGNKVAGSKGTGFTLTGPGEIAAAEVIRQMQAVGK